MKISEISATVIDHMGSDLSVVNAARVSFHKESKWEPDGKGFRTLSEADTRLINYLARHKHYSPFNHTFISSRIRAPIFVARQLVKHKFMPWNEVSRRYVDEEPEFYIPQARKRSDNVKQGSSEELVELMTMSDHITGEPWVSSVDSNFYLQAEQALHFYNSLLRNYVAPEVARAVLPQNMMTEWIWSGTLGAYADMLHLRLDPHTQYESRIVAQKLREQIEPLYPVSLKALLENK